MKERQGWNGWREGRSKEGMVGIITGMEGLKVHPPCPLVFMSCRPSHSFNYRSCPSHFQFLFRLVRYIFVLHGPGSSFHVCCLLFWSFIFFVFHDPAPPFPFYSVSLALSRSSLFYFSFSVGPFLLSSYCFFSFIPPFLPSFCPSFLPSFPPSIRERQRER